jgi:D-glycero-D-manno-heptose 1,7-bisphosphate phosphatase
MNRAVFLDRDGVINRAIVRGGKPYPPASPEEFQYVPGIQEACARLKKAGFILVVATNQPDVGRGKTSADFVSQIHEKISDDLPIDHVEVCFDSGLGNTASLYRKPAPGMLQKAAAMFDIDLPESYMIGDRWRDIDCGKAAGCVTVLIDYGYNEELKQQPDYTVKSVTEAVDVILKHETQKRLRNP